MSTNPIQDPRSHDTFALDNIDCPGIAKIKSGGDRAQEWQEQQSPLTTAVQMIMRKEHASRIVYQVEIWGIAQFNAWEQFIAMLNAGKAKRPVRTYRLIDPRVAHNGIRTVAYGSCGPQVQLAPGKWGYDLELVEKPKSAPIGGPALPAKSEQEKRNEALNQQAVDLGKQLAALQAGAAKGK